MVLKSFRTIALSICFLFSPHSFTQSPNIMLVIADDFGVDVCNGYYEEDLMPTTPTLDSIRNVGITFENVWAAPSCTPTRATIMSGKYGCKTGVLGVPGHLDITHTSLFTALPTYADEVYSNAVIGKWHISLPADPDHPEDHGVEYYTGVLESSVPDYYEWPETEFGTTTTNTNYVTTELTNDAIDWIDTQTSPWAL